MMDGRVAIIGDSAAIPRPHTAASTSKAAANALALADELQAFSDDIPAALARWEPDQVAVVKGTVSKRSCELFEAKAGRQSPRIPIQQVTCMRPAFLSRDALNE
jgi:2-polyprenyl-6-methoxyphenol hydroxylase-like FAD-dependent oxidoreductase